MPLPSLHRRAFLGATAAVALPAAAQPRPAARPLVVAQLVDVSPGEQDIAKDFLIGARAAWQDLNARGGVRGRPVQHLVIEVDGTAAGVRQAWVALRDNAACVALSGTVSDPIATELARLLHSESVALAHVAPWLQNGAVEPDERTYPIFATRREQIAHALKSLTATGVQEVGVVYASVREAGLYREELARAAAALKLRVAFTASGDLEKLGQRLGPATPALLLFIGGTPELVQFTQGLDRQSRQRYVVAMADVNLQTVAQMGAGRNTPIIATQVVPMTGSALPIVRRYREVLARLFDEAPVALSLAGFIAAQCTWEVLNEVEGPVTRAAVLAACQRRHDRDLGGYRPGFVTQSMLTADGRVVG